MEGGTEGGREGGKKEGGWEFKMHVLCHQC